MKSFFGYDPSAARFEENGKTVTMVSLLIPMLFEQIFLLMYGTANTLVLSGYSQDAVSAISVSNQLNSLALVIIGMIIKGTVIIISVAIGSKDNRRAESVSGTGAILTAFFGVLLGAILSIGAGSFMKLMKLQGAAYDMAVSHLFVSGLFLPVTTLLSYTNNLLITNGHTKCTMIVGLAGNLMNIALSYAVLYTGVPLPVSGATAVALAAGISQTVCLGFAVLFFRKKRCPFLLRVERAHIFDIFRLGVPGGMAGFSWTLSQTVTTSFIAPLGYIAINTKVYVTNIVNYIAQTSFAFGNANTVLMGRHRGNRDFSCIQKLFRQNLCIITLSNLVLSLICFFFRDMLIGLFTDDAAIFGTAVSVMLIDIVLEMGRGVNHIAEGSLNANGDVRTTLVVSVISCWLCGVFLGYMLCVKAGLGLIGLWLGFAADELFKGVFYLLRWRSGKWKNTKI